MAHVLFGLSALFLNTLSLLLHAFFLHRGVPWLLYGVVSILQDHTTILFYVTFLLIWIIK